MKTKRFKIKLYRILGIKRCKRREKYADCPNIYSHKKVAKTVYPTDWLNKVSYICKDGTTITYNPISNQKATDEALEKLKKESIEGKSL